MSKAAKMSKFKQILWSILTVAVLLFCTVCDVILGYATYVFMYAGIKFSSWPWNLILISAGLFFGVMALFVIVAIVHIVYFAVQDIRKVIRK